LRERRRKQEGNKTKEEENERKRDISSIFVCLSGSGIRYPCPWLHESGRDVRRAQPEEAVPFSVRLGKCGVDSEGIRSPYFQYLDTKKAF
jgi:hypothetical protein